MIELDVTQGSQEWLEARLTKFTASEAPMMMGDSKYISRTQLLDHKKGWISEVNEFTQKIFDAGHRAEAMARPIASKLAGVDFYPVVGLLEDSKYLASFDGITMMEDVLFEHKLYNKVLAENVLNNVLGREYYWQLEHQLLVSGADKVLFVCSDGTEEKFYSMWYVSLPERRDALVAGWEQFAIDLESHEAQAKAEKVTANAISDLPVIRYEMNGMSLTSNLDAFKEAATKLVEKSKVVIETDQDFADADAMVKVFKTTEGKIKALLEQVVGEVKDIDLFTKDLKFIGEEIRQARLTTDKQVKTRKEEIRGLILNEFQSEITESIQKAATKVKAIIPPLDIDIANSMKGKKTIDSLRDAASSEVAKGKIELAGYVELALTNGATINEIAVGYKFLFVDWPQIAFKANDDFTALVKSRISDHKEAEQKRLDAEREKIRIEEQAKAEIAAQDKIDEEARLQREEANRIALECAQESPVVRKNDAQRQEEIVSAVDDNAIPESLKESSSTIAGQAKQQFKRTITPTEAAFIAGFISRNEINETLIDPKKTAAFMASEYTKRMAA